MIETYDDETFFCLRRDWESACPLDRKNKKPKWADSEQLEIKQLFDYEFAKDRGKLKPSDPTLEGYKKSDVG